VLFRLDNHRINPGLPQSAIAPSVRGGREKTIVPRDARLLQAVGRPLAITVLADIQLRPMRSRRLNLLEVPQNTHSLKLLESLFCSSARVEYGRNVGVQGGEVSSSSCSNINILAGTTQRRIYIFEWA
jgi:hypothetical protein